MSLLSSTRPVRAILWRRSSGTRMFAPEAHPLAARGGAAMDELPAGVPHTLAERYTLERELGRGGTATVYLARDGHSGELVAVKILRPELAESIAAKKFVREIWLNDDLDHPRIVGVVDSGESQGQLYFVLPYMSGGSLRDRLNRVRQLPLDEAIAVACDVAEALSYAHRRGYIHRDVKPENILLHEGRANLADFGIARAIERSSEDSTTTTGFVRGTAAYLSPEQASASPAYDGRSDIYSLGCVLYEMLAGMQAFVGPSTESIIAQRFKHTPRDVRVYRPRVPDSLARVVEIALQISPADRFQTAEDFSAELVRASRDPALVVHPRRRVLRRAAVPVAAAIFATGVWGASQPLQRALGIAAPSLDTTRIAVLPLEGDTALPLAAAQDVLYSGFATWRGITLADRGADRPFERVAGDRQARRAAEGIGAGRYVRMRVTRVGDRLNVRAGLYDVRERIRLHEVGVSVPMDVGSADTTLFRLSRELLLRGSARPYRSRVLPAVQLFERALREIEAFNLRAADSLLFASIEADEGFLPAALWLAQVRSWQRKPAGEWMTWVERALGGSELESRERQLGAALAALGRGEFPKACESYAALRESDGRDFAAWYGLGQCQGLDDVVIRDPRSPSGWRFRGSSHASAQAYARALMLAPAVHRTFEARAYSALRDLLFVRPGYLRRGISSGRDSERFLAYPSWAGDSLVHVPHPADDVTSGRVRSDVQLRAAALQRQRELLTRVTETWSAALPRSPGAKEALAIALEQQGDLSAIDTLRAARALSRDPALRLRLAAEEVHARVSLGRRNPSQLRAAAALADSLLANAAEASSEDAATLAPLAALRGLCALAAQLASRATSHVQSRYLNMPLSAVKVADSVNVLSAVGCRSAADTVHMHQAVEAVFDNPTWRADRSQQRIEYQLFGRSVMLTMPFDTVRVHRMAAVEALSALPVVSSALRGSHRTVRDMLERRRRLRIGGVASADALLPEAAALLLIGDTAAAMNWVAGIYQRVSWLDQTLTDPVTAGALVRAQAMYAELSASRGDEHSSSEAATFVAILWNRADPALHSRVARMKLLAR